MIEQRPDIVVVTKGLNDIVVLEQEGQYIHEQVNDEIDRLGL